MDIVLENHRIKTLNNLKMMRDNKIDNFLQDIINDSIIISTKMDILERENNKITCTFNQFTMIEIGIQSKLNITKIELYNNDNLIRTLDADKIYIEYYKDDNSVKKSLIEIYDLKKLLGHRVPVTKYVLYFEPSEDNIINNEEINMIHSIPINNYEMKMFLRLLYDST